MMMTQGPRKRASSSRSSGEALTGGSAIKKTTTKMMKRDDGTTSRRVTTGEGLQYWQGRLSTDKTLISTAAEYNPNLKKKPPSLRPTSTTPPTATDPEDLNNDGPNDAPSSPASLSSLSRTIGVIPPPPPPQIFSGLTIYLNGSTHPHISDHKLKHVLAQHGANVAIALGRRTVTHVILGDKGGLAAGKIQKEVARPSGGATNGVKFVGVRWALDSVERGKRQPERRYEVVKLALRGQRSVLAVGRRGKGGEGESKLRVV